MNEDYINYMMTEFMKDILLFESEWQQSTIQVSIEVAGEVKPDDKYYAEWQVIKSKMEQVGREAKYYA